MSKIKTAKLDIVGNRRPKAVTRKVVRSSSGRLMDVYTVDANSPTFSEDLTYVYRTNVKNARRENKKLFGSPDGFSKSDRRTKHAVSLNVSREK